MNALRDAQQDELVCVPVGKQACISDLIAPVGRPAVRNAGCKSLRPLHDSMESHHELIADCNISAVQNLLRF